MMFVSLNTGFVKVAYILAWSLIRFCDAIHTADHYLRRKFATKFPRIRSRNTDAIIRYKYALSMSQNDDITQLFLLSDA